MSGVPVDRGRIIHTPEPDMHRLGPSAKLCRAFLFIRRNWKLSNTMLNDTPVSPLELGTYVIEGY